MRKDMKQEQLPIFPLMWSEIEHSNGREKIPVFALGHSLCQIAKRLAKQQRFDNIQFFFGGFFRQLIEEKALSPFEPTRQFINITWSKPTKDGIGFLFYNPTLDNIAKLWGKTVREVQDEFAQQVATMLMSEFDRANEQVH
jgi:hypothetical protein